MKAKELSSILVVGAILFIAPRPSSAQTNDFKSQYEDFKKQARVEYEDFRAQCNAEYAEFVKEAWKEYKALPAIPRPKDEIVSPIIRPNKDKGKIREEKAITIKDIVSPIEQTPQPKPISPIYGKEQQAENKCQFTYCGTEYTVRFPSAFSLDLGICDNQYIAEAWKELSTNQLDNTIRDFLEIRIKMQLCDWAYLISVFHRICKKVKIMNDYLLHLCESFRGMFFVTCLFFLFCFARRNDVVSNRVNSFTNRVKCSKKTITIR